MSVTAHKGDGCVFVPARGENMLAALVENPPPPLPICCCVDFGLGRDGGRVWGLSTAPQAEYGCVTRSWLRTLFARSNEGGASPDRNARAAATPADAGRPKAAPHSQKSGRRMSDTERSNQKKRRGRTCLHALLR